MHGAEGVGDVNAVGAGQIGQRLGDGGIVLGLALFKAGILQQQDLAGLQSGGLGLRIGTDHVGGEDHGLVQQLAQALRHGGEGQLLQALLPLLLGDVLGLLALLHLLLHVGIEGGDRLAQVGAGDDSGALVQKLADGGQGGADALIIRDGAGGLVLRHVEIAAQKDLLALHVHIVDRFFVVVHALSSSDIVPVVRRFGNPCCRRAS